MKQFFNESNQDVFIYSETFSHLVEKKEQFLLSLSVSEKNRAQNYRVEKARQEFILARGFLREKLSLYLNQLPHELEIDVDYYGKPFVRQAPVDFNFNLSHSGDRIILAVTYGAVLGIDVEKLNFDQDLSLAHQVFSDTEIRELSQYKASQQVKAFFKGWTQKEAYIKALGLGLSAPLKEFSVTLNPDCDGVPINTRAGEMKSIAIDVEYSCSLFILGQNSNIVICNN